MTITLSYNGDLSRVQLSASDLPEARYATVERSLNQVIWSTVRGGLAVPIVGGEIAVDDYEFLSDQQNFYRVTPHDHITGFEADVSGWEPVGGTFAHSTAQAHDGAGAGLLTPDGASATARARTVLAGSPAAVPDIEHELSVWVYRDATGSRDVDISVEFFDAADVSLEFVVWATETVPEGVWTRIAGARVAPAGTAKAQLNINQRDTPSASDLLYVDDVEFSPVAFTPETGSITPSLAGKVWLKNVRYPFLNTELDDFGFTPKTRPARAGSFPVSGRVLPVAVSDRHGGREFTLSVVTSTDQDAARLDLVTAAGGIVFLHVPPTLDVVGGGYYLLGDVANRPLADSVPASRTRVFDLPLSEHAQPGPDIVGTTMTWGTLLRLYGSWEALLAAHATWRDAFQTISSPEDLVTL